MKTEKIPYRDGDAELEGHLVYDDSVSGERPVVLVSHAWAGQGDFERGKAADLAGLGYVGFALDMFGKGVYGGTVEKNSALIKPFVEDRARLFQRIAAGLEAARGHAAADASRVAAIGFCFGGMCVLDLARGGADVAGVVSFHGLLGPTGLPDPPRITARVLALHGYDDPMARPDVAVAFADEMTAAGADWQMHMYGNTVHAFTNPAAADPDFGTVYDEAADRRSWQAMRNFLGELFAA